ncbi:MAG TPA: hypothetical protein PK402_02655, partial [Tepidisphaeraceae bacterium]|nr:hypothetical protein [Tepidisphaeraceae bacterium]
GTSESFVLSNRIGGSAAGEGNVIGGNTSSGIAAQLGSAGTTIEGNFIGTDPTGTQARPNGEAGVALIDSQGNTVGGPSASQRNVISGNDDDGVRILTIGEASTPANSNTVLNNYIGTNATGTAALPNSLYGVRIIGGSNNQIGDAFLTGNAGNVISGNGLGGIGIGVDTPDFEEAGTTANNVIQNNRIGTNAAGNAAIPNTGHGIFVTQIGGIIIEGGTNILTSGTMIGSAGITITQGGNLISGNGADGLHNGIRIENGPFNTTILGNRIGTNASGNAALGNFGSGIQIRQSSSTTIGSTAGGGGNIIAGNGGAGIIAFGDTNTVDTAIVANAIGTNFAGTVDMGNGGSGIVISGTLNNIDRNVMIGGATNAAGNRIAFNNFGGVSVSNGAGIEITRNRIYSNDNGLGIDLGALGITPNDTGDGDLGANNLQNFPVLAPVTQVGTDVTIPTALNSTASTTFRIDYYAVVAPDPSGSGEGNFYLGSANVTTNGSGNMTTFPTFSLANAPGATAVTATATRQGTFSDTSEFAANRLIADNFAPTLVGEASFVFDADVQSLNYLFNENVGGSLTTADFILENLTTSQIIPSANISVSYNADFNRATFTFPGYTNGVLPDGNYRATLVADGINDPSGNDLAGGDDVSEFFFLNGDVNRDRFVDFNDLLVVAQNYGVSGRTFTQGNVNYSVGGLVDFNDVLIIAQKYGVELPLIRARGPLGNTRINDDVLSITDFSRFQI